MRREATLIVVGESMPRLQSVRIRVAKRFVSERAIAVPHDDVGTYIRKPVKRIEVEQHIRIDREIPAVVAVYGNEVDDDTPDLKCDRRVDQTGPNVKDVFGRSRVNHQRETTPKVAWEWLVQIMY